jgi:hypothetical protein
MVQELQESRVEETHFSLVFPTILGKISLTKAHIDGKLR